MAKIMRQGNGFGQIGIKPQTARQRSGDLCYFQTVSQAGAKMTALVSDINLSLIFEPAKSLTMNDSIAVALEFGSQAGRPFRNVAPTRIGAEHRVRRQPLTLRFFDGLPVKDGHGPL